MSDLISRQAVLDFPIRLNHYDEEHGNRDFVLGIESVMEYVESLPSAEPKGDYCPMASRVCFANGKEFVWCLTCPHISEEDRTLVKKAVEPKTGRWIPVDSFSAYGGDEATWGAHGNPIAFYYCSECKEHAYAGEDGESLLTDFCPHCGADMRGEEDDKR